MTSFSTAESPQSKAELFTVPADQMSHIQIFPVTQAPVAARCELLELSPTTPLNNTGHFSAVGGPGQPHHGDARAGSDEGRAHALRHEPRLFLAAFGLRQSA